GLHIGEAELTGEKVGGIAVTTAARTAALAGPGQVLATDTIVHMVAGSELEFTDVGSRELKGVPGRWELFSLDAVDAESIGPPLDPQQAVEFRERASLREQLTRGRGLVVRRLPAALGGRRVVALAVAVVVTVVAVPLIASRTGKGPTGLAANAVGAID